MFYYFLLFLLFYYFMYQITSFSPAAGPLEFIAVIYPSVIFDSKVEFYLNTYTWNIHQQQAVSKGHF